MNCDSFLCAVPIIKPHQHMHGDFIGIRSRQQFVSPGKVAFPPTQGTDGLHTASHGRSPRDPLLGLGCAERCRGQPRCKVHPRDYVAHDGVHEHSLVIWIHPCARRSDKFLTNICQMGRSTFKWAAWPSPLFPLLHRRRQTNRSINIAPLIFQSLTAALHRTTIRAYLRYKRNKPGLGFSRPGFLSYARFRLMDTATRKRARSILRRASRDPADSSTRLRRGGSTTARWWKARSAPG